MSEDNKPFTLKEAVLARVPELDGLTGAGRRDDGIVAYLAAELVTTLRHYDQAKARARSALANAGRQVKEQQGYLDSGYSPQPTWLAQAAEAYATESAAMKAAADRAMEQAYILRKLIDERAEDAVETATRMGMQLKPGKPVPAFPSESKEG